MGVDMKAKYSIVMYHDTINEKIVGKIEDILSHGIIVHLFVTHSSESCSIRDSELLSGKSIQFALKHRFLQVYELENLYEHQDIIAVDGNGVNETFEFIVDDVKYAIEQEDITLNRSIFNIDQYNVVHSSENSDLIVKASAGTGKTTCMIDRIMYLKHMNVELEFDSIAMITFTNKATVSMREKLFEKLEHYFEMTRKREYLDWMQKVETLHISTLHLFAKHVLDLNKQKIGRHQDIQLRSYKMKRRKLIEKYITEFLKRQNYDNALAESSKKVYRLLNRIPFYILVKWIEKVHSKLRVYSLSTLKNNIQFGFGSGDFDTYCFGNLAEFVIRKVDLELEAFKEMTGFYEVDDLIGLTHEFSEQVQPNISFRYIFIDEFQDTDIEQLKFLLKVVKAGQTEIRLLIVGDKKQSIYRFRGAEMNAFEFFKSNINGYRWIEAHLRLNYRTDYRLIKRFNAIFENLTRAKISQIYDEGDKMISFKASTNAKEDLQKILSASDQSIGEHLQKTYRDIDDSSSITVLVRNNSDVMKIGEMCDKLRLPFEGLTSGDFFRTDPVKELYILINYLSNPTNEKNMVRMLGTSYFNVSEDVMQAYFECKDDLFELLTSSGIIGYVDRIKYESPIVILDEILSNFSPEVSYYLKIQKKFLGRDVKEGFSKVKALEYKLNLDKCMYMIKSEFSHSGSLFHILNYLKININTNTDVDPEKFSSIGNLDKDQFKVIRALTIHKSKGLEFEHVVIPFTTRKLLSHHRESIDIHISHDLINHYKVCYKLKLGKHEHETNRFYENFEKIENRLRLDEEIRLLYVALTRSITSTSVHIGKGNIGDCNNWSDVLRWGYCNES